MRAVQVAAIGGAVPLTLTLLSASSAVARRRRTQTRPPCPPRRQGHRRLGGGRRGRPRGRGRGSAAARRGCAPVGGGAGGAGQGGQGPQGGAGEDPARPGTQAGAGGAGVGAGPRAGAGAGLPDQRRRRACPRRATGPPGGTALGTWSDEPRHAPRTHRTGATAGARRSEHAVRGGPHGGHQGQAAPARVGRLPPGQASQRRAGPDSETRRQGPPGHLEAARRPAALWRLAPSSTSAARRSSA